jgi:uncharacterized sulfatase
LDIFPTILKQIGIPPPNDRIIDGVDIMPLLQEGENATYSHPDFFYLWDEKVFAVRDKTWKYHRKHMNDNSTYWPIAIGPLLFNIVEDPNESYNQLSAHPKDADRLKLKLEQFQQELDNNPRGWKV